MRNLLALLFFVPSLCLAQSVTSPYNPDINADSAITSTDLLGLLPIFASFFTPEEVMIDGMTINEYLLLVEENGGSLSIEGSAYGQMLFWNGEEWTLVPAGVHGEVLTIEGTTPTWQAPSEGDTPEVGCADQSACNYDAGASVNWAPLCVYEDECGVCDGPGAIYECGCADLPEGDCDCDGNQLDALNVCGGTCAADVDGDGICDDGDDCIGEADECGVCNGPGAIYECGCSEPDPEACDCAGNTLDAVGVCGGGCTEDADGDGICDTEDDCVGEYDFCGVCNGPGPIIGCGCEDIPDGYCDCNGNVLDAVGTCGGACQNDFNGDGICDDDSIPGCTYEVACNYDPSASINDGSCDFTSCYGCTDPAACNYSPAATFDNGVCWYAEASYDCDFNCLLDTDGDGVCDDLEVFGCTDGEACNYDPSATDDGPCEYCSCAGQELIGCVDEAACNFNPIANCPDSSCTYPGCNNPLADNFDEAAGCNDGSCVVYGCTVDLACNYEPTANIDDDSCEFGTCPGCNDTDAVNYNPTSTNTDACNYCIEPLLYQGHYYELVEVAGHCWFAENLRSTAYQNGNPIPEPVVASEWNSFAGMTSVYGSFGCLQGLSALPCDTDTMHNTYGRLYNGWAVLDESNVCPLGWHVPTEGEFETLIESLGGMNFQTWSDLTFPSWYTNPVFGTPPSSTNSTGLSLLHGGVIDAGGTSVFSEYFGFYASSTFDGMDLRVLSLLNAGGISIDNWDIRSGFSVRCIAD